MVDVDGVILVGLGRAMNGLGLKSWGVDGFSVVDDTVLEKSGLALESGIPVVITPSWDGSWTSTTNVPFSV